MYARVRAPTPPEHRGFDIGNYYYYYDSIQVYIYIVISTDVDAVAVLTHDKNEARNKEHKKIIYYRLVKQIIFVSFTGWVNIETSGKKRWRKMCASWYMHGACDIKPYWSATGEWIKSAYGFKSVVADAVACRSCRTHSIIIYAVHAVSLIACPCVYF